LNIDPAVVLPPYSLLLLAVGIFAGILMVVARYGNWNGTFGFISVAIGLYFLTIALANSSVGSSAWIPWLWIAGSILFLFGLFLSIRTFHR